MSRGRGCRGGSSVHRLFSAKLERKPKLPDSSVDV